MPPARTRPPLVADELHHMLEEVGRHVGHLDVVRELIDGRTGYY